MSTDNPKDGFDLIEYPCEYGFKAMCKMDHDDPEANKNAVKGLVLQFLNEGDVLNIHSRQSRTGKFESVTISVRLANREQLESIYQALSGSPTVVMTL